MVGRQAPIVAVVVAVVLWFAPGALAGWTSTGSLNAARADATATLLGNGDVLVAGGDVGGNALASAELYDPTTGTWTATGSMTTARYDGTATLLPSGKVLVAGGQGSGHVAMASAELYDPTTGMWSSAGTMTTARYFDTATRLSSGKVLVAGGQDSSNAVLASAELYDPVANTWTATGSLITGRYQHTATLLSSGKVLVAGGVSSGGIEASAELYSPATATWSATGSMTSTRSGATTTLLGNGDVLAAGGYNGSYLASAELYNPATGTWGATGSMNNPRFEHTATLLGNGDVLAAGGTNGTATMASAELYDPSTGTWSPTQSMSTARLQQTATLLTNGKVLVAGGLGSLTALASSELFSVPASPTLSASAPGSGTAGSPISASSVSAALSGGSSPSGTITFQVFGPQATAPSDCSTGGIPVGTAVSVSGNGTYNPSAAFTPSAAGDYWWYASYGGDSNNNASASTCGAMIAETVVGAASPTVSLSVPAAGTAGTAIPGSNIQAVLSNGASPSGAITFEVFGPQATAPVDCSIGGTTVGPGVTVSGNGTYNPSAAFTPPAAGDYWWYASYSGDSNNNASVSTCGAMITETVAYPISPTLTMSAPPSDVSGHPIPASGIQATLSAGASPSGAITFERFGPQASAPTDCSTGGTAVGTAVSVSGNGGYNASAGFTPSAPGDYWWIANYSGDSSNNPTSSACGPDMAETTVSLPAPPSNESRPLIHGTPKDGQTLITDHGGWASPDPLTFTYQWQRCTATGTNCTKITGATHAAYKPTSADVGHRIRAVVSATDPYHQTGQAASTAVGPVAKPPAPRNTKTPAISGTPTQGQTLKTTNGSWSSPDPLTFAYQWERCTATGTNCTKITGGTRSFYKLTSADAGHKIIVQVTATDREHQAGLATAKPVGPVKA